MSAASPQQIYFEVLRNKLHFCCDYREDSMPEAIKQDIAKFIGIPIEDQILKVQHISAGEENEWRAIDDKRRLGDQGFTGKTAKADSPVQLALVLKSDHEEVRIIPVSTPPPMPETMRTNRENPDNDA